MDNSLSADINILNIDRTYHVMVAVGSRGAMSTYTFQNKGFMIEVLSRVGITVDEINNAIVNYSTIHREKIDQRGLEIVLTPYAVRE